MKKEYKFVLTTAAEMFLFDTLTNENEEWKTPFMQFLEDNYIECSKTVIYPVFNLENNQWVVFNTTDPVIVLVCIIFDAYHCKSLFETNAQIVEHMKRTVVLFDEYIMQIRHCIKEAHEHFNTKLIDL
jgi:hypothetical protein